MEITPELEQKYPEVVRAERKKQAEKAERDSYIANGGPENELNMRRFLVAFDRAVVALESIAKSLKE